MRQIILFDIDGTLLLTGGAGKAAFNDTFVELFQKSEAWQDIVPHGRTDPCILRELFHKNFGRAYQAHEQQSVFHLYAQKMEQSLAAASHFRVLPGIVPLLEALSQKPYTSLGLATGNLQATAWLKLKKAGLDHYFNFGGFGSDAENRLELTRIAFQRGLQQAKAWVEPEEVYLIGDSIHDLRCGKMLGFNTVGVATGGTSSTILKSHRPDFLFEDFSNFEEVLSVLD